MIKTNENINKIIDILKNNKYIHFAFIIIIGIILSVGLNKIQIEKTHDGAIHYLRILGTVDIIKIGQFPSLINQNYCLGSGYAINLFYPPLVTYLPLIIKLFTSSYMTCLKIFGGICIILSGFTMYQFTYEVTKNRIIAFFSAFFYMICPYKIGNIYKRYAIGEFTAAVFIPLVFLGLDNLLNNNGKKHYYIAIGATCILLSHSITTLYLAIICIIYILFDIKKLKNIDVIKKCIVNGIFILMMSALFIIPLVEATRSAEYVIMNNETMRTTGTKVYSNTIPLSRLFIDEQVEDATTFKIGLPTLCVIIMTFFAYKKLNENNKKMYLIFILFSCICIIMISRIFPWYIIPNFLCKLQFPWRMLSFFAFFISYICGTNLYIICKNIVNKYLRIILIVIFIFFSIIYTLCILTKFYTSNLTIDSEYTKKIENNKKIPCMCINREYMPLKAAYKISDYVKNRKDCTYILKGNVNIIEERKENLSDTIKIGNVSEGTILEFPYFYYPGYEIKIKKDGLDKLIKSFESDNGYVACEITEDISDECTLEIEYVGTPATRISYAVSFISLIIFIIYIIYTNIKNKKGEKIETEKIN